MSTKANGLTTKHKERESISIKMVLPTQESGITINNMDTVTKNGQMELNTKEIMFRV